MRKRRHPLNRIPQPWRKIVDWLVTIAVAWGVVLVFEAQVAMPYRIPSSSMEPTLHCARPGYECRASTDDRVLALRIVYDFESPRRYQMVVFKAPETANRCGPGMGGTSFVKRIIGLPGEEVREDAHGFVWVREPGSTGWTRLKTPAQLNDEPYVDRQSRRSDRSHFNHTWNVPNGDYFMMGDNRGISCDSRTWGAVPRANLIGPVEVTYWPLNRIGFP
jgi:signal peptidase I